MRWSVQSVNNIAGSPSGERAALTQPVLPT